MEIILRVIVGILIVAGCGVAALLLVVWALVGRVDFNEFDDRIRH